jgi:outer membrane protein OmpA-like peptidoglycan-associated protein
MTKKILALCTISLLTTGCVTDPQTGQTSISKTAMGAGAGALIGGGIGALVGNKHKGKAAAIGAAAGAALGAGAGYYLQSQEAALQAGLQGTDATVQRQGNDLAVVMPGGVTFATGSSTLSSSAYPALNSVVTVLNQTPTLTMTVAGYTDSVGSAASNQVLSQSRAQSVTNYLTQQGITGSRIETVGYGASNFVGSNDTDAGRAQNRRVEIKIHSPQQ